MTNHIHHDLDHTQSRFRLLLTFLLNVLITLFEIIGGFISGSISLISDAVHNFSDAFSIIISYIAISFSNKPYTVKYTFGFKRAEIIAAIINGSTLSIINFFLIKEAIQRILTPPEKVDGAVMFWIALAGLIVNTAATLLLKKDSKSNLNIKSTYLHLLGDAITSAAVIIGSVFIMFFDIYWLDPVITLIISIYIFKETYKIIKESTEILMMFAPADIDLNKVKELVEKVPGVLNIHHIHIWRLNDKNIHFEAHIDVDDMLLSKTTNIQRDIEDQLRNIFQITHITLQFESNTCINKELVINQQTL